MIDPLICACANALGLTPGTFAFKVGIAKAAGHQGIDAITTAYLDCADPGFDVCAISVPSAAAKPAAIAANLCGPGRDCDVDDRVEIELGLGLFVNCGGKQRVIMATPLPWELTEPEGFYSRTSVNRALHMARHRSDPGRGEQVSLGQSRRGATGDDKEGA